MNLTVATDAVKEARVCGDYPDYNPPIAGTRHQLADAVGGSRHGAT
jgi:hypothetical protein